MVSSTISKSNINYSYYNSFNYKNIYTSTRFGYDLPKVFLFNVGYIFRYENIKYIPTIGIIANKMTGISTGLDIHYSKNKINITSLNQFMIDCKYDNSLVYNWTEFSYEIKTYFKPGMTIMPVYYFNSKSYTDVGVNVFTTINNIDIGVYCFNFWNESRYLYLSLSYTFK